MLLQNERQNEIVRRLKERQSVRIGDLTKIFNVTRETVRRDIYELEKQGIVKKVHGGAVLNKASAETPYSLRSVSRTGQKEAIARKAADFVEDGDTLYIDLGTTTLLFAGELRSKQHITVITNALQVAIELSRHPSAKVILCGGELRPSELSLSGPTAIKGVEDFFVDKAFVGAGGISVVHGVTDYHVGEAEMRRTMLKKAKENFILVDASKFNVAAFTKVCGIDTVDNIITDQAVPEIEIALFKEQGLDLILAEAAE